MYLIRKTRTFKKSYKKLKKSGIKLSVLKDLKSVINTLAKGVKLTRNHEDHELAGDYYGYRDCHVKGDLVLVYKIEKDKLILILVDIGSHSELF